MRYDQLTIYDVPKSFDVMNVVEYIEPVIEGLEMLEPQYDSQPCEHDSLDAVVVYKYNESSTGVLVAHNPECQYVDLQLSQWANECDVYIFAAIANAVLNKHKRARLFYESKRLTKIRDIETDNMILERKLFLKRCLAFEEGFCMQGLFTSFTLKVEHLRPAISPDMQALELERMFTKMQWEDHDDN